MRNKFYMDRLFKNARCKMPILLDADDGMTGSEVGGVGGSSSDSADDDETLESLRAQLAKINAEKEKYKNSIDNLTRKNKELTDKNRQHMTTEQLEKEAQEEREKRFAEMEKELRTNRYSKKLVSIGMPEADADAFASTLPEMEDSDTFFNTLATFISAKEKAAGENAVQELLKNRPDINAGNGDADKDSPALTLAKASVESRKNQGNNTNILKSYM